MAKRYIPKRFLGAFKAGHRASAREFIDEELSYKLLQRILDSNYEDSDALQLLDYITKFNNEYHKCVIKKGDTEAFHHTNEMRKDRTDANNARNRDISSVHRHRMDYLTPHPVETPNGVKMKHLYVEMHYANQEDVLVELIDLKNTTLD